MIMPSLLLSKLEDIRNTRASFNDGLKSAVDFVRTNGGVVRSYDDWGTLMTFVKLGSETGYIFQPYVDIDLFYFEA